MNKKYKAIFFDWDGTAVTSRTAPGRGCSCRNETVIAAGNKARDRKRDNLR